MSSPATPTGTRRRPTTQQSVGWSGDGSNSLGGSGGGWLGQLGGIVGDMLQGWGLLGALRGRGAKTSTASGWGSFGGVGGGLGATGGFGAYSSPSSPLANSRTSSPHPSSGENIELMPLSGQNPCFLRIEGLGKGGAGHRFGEATPLDAPTWCDACAHLIFTAPVTCANCSYTCHEQCRALVAIDCRARLTPEGAPPDGGPDPHQGDHLSKELEARLQGDGSHTTTTLPNASNNTQEPLLLSSPSNNHPDHSTTISDKASLLLCDKQDGGDALQQSKELKQLSNDLKTSPRLGSDDTSTNEGEDDPLTREGDPLTKEGDPLSDDDEDNSSDYATLENELTLVGGSSLSIHEGLSTQQLQQHLLQQQRGHGEEEKHEGERQEKDLVAGGGVSPDSTSLRRAIVGLCERGGAPSELEAWLLDTAAAQGLQLNKEQDGSYRGCLRVHLNLSRPINIVAGTRPPSIYDILQEDRTIEKTLTSFYMPRNAVKAIHITSKTTTREVIVALLRKFKVVDNPQKFALYERSYDQNSTKGSLLRLSDTACPLVLAMAWTAQGLTRHRVVLQENDTADIQWDAFSLPELNNFLRILDREERDYRTQIQDKYARIRGYIGERLTSAPLS